MPIGDAVARPIHLPIDCVVAADVEEDDRALRDRDRQCHAVCVGQADGVEAL